LGLAAIGQAAMPEGAWPNHADFSMEFVMLLDPFAILLFASFSSFARRKRRRGGSPDWHEAILVKIPCILSGNRL
jgi:hypothetical protein